MSDILTLPQLCLLLQYSMSLVTKIVFPASDNFKKRVLYKKHQGPAVQMDIIEMMNVDSYLMCGEACVGKTDCSAFRVEENEGKFRCE